MDEILFNLQAIKDLRVISRTPVEKYRGPDKPAIPEIDRELGVNFIVEGSGQKYGKTFRLRIQLIRAPKGSHLLAGSYEKELDLAKIYILSGEYDLAMDKVEFLLTIPGDLSIPLLKIDPVYDKLRNLPRFQQILSK